MVRCIHRNRNGSRCPKAAHEHVTLEQLQAMMSSERAAVSTADPETHCFVADPFTDGRLPRSKAKRAARLGDRLAQEALDRGDI